MSHPFLEISLVEREPMPKTKDLKRAEAAQRVIAASGLSVEQAALITEEFKRLATQTEAISSRYKQIYGTAPHMHDAFLDLGCQRCVEDKALEEAIVSEHTFYDNHRSVLKAYRSLASH